MINLDQNSKMIFILDDDQVFSYALELYLENQGYTIKVFHNVYAFFKGLKLCKPDYFILDFALNDNYEGIVNGAQVAKRINNTHGNIPIIMLSAQKNLQVAVDLFSNQIVDYVVKDDDFHENIKRILVDLDEMMGLSREIEDLKTQSRIRLKRFFIVLGSALLFWVFMWLFV